MGQSKKFFDQPEVEQYIHTLLNIFGQNSNGVKQLLPSARTLKRYADACASEICNNCNTKLVVIIVIHNCNI